MMAKSPITWETIAIDGGWGWMVVLGSFLIHVFADGIVYSFGIMVVELLEVFGEGRAVTSWIISLLTGLTLGIGPFASAVTNRFGCRATTIVGALVASFGCFISYFATSAYFLMVSVGIVMGLGFGLMYCPAIIIVTMYFEERRAFATGIAVCGAGFGTFIFAPFSAYLIQTFTWRGAFLIYSGIILNCVVCGALFHPLTFRPIYGDDPTDTQLSVEMPSSRERTEPEVQFVNGKDHVHSLSAINPEGFPLIRTAQSHNAVDLQSENCPDMALSYEHLARMNDRLRKGRHKTVSESHGYLNIKDVFYAGSIAHIPDFVAHHDQYRSLISLRSHPIPSVSAQLTDGKQEVTTTIRHPLTIEEDKSYGWKDAMSVFKMMVDVNLLMDPVFLLFAISNFLTSIGFNTPLVFLPDRASNELGISAEASSWIVSAFGISNTIGRVCVGFLCDREWICDWAKQPRRNRLWVYNLSLTVCGLGTCLSFICTDLTSLVIYSAIFGFTISSYVCLTSVLLVDLLGLDKLTNAFGLLLLFQGIATLVGPPIAGEIVDHTGNYAYSFLFAGIGLTISGLMLYLVPFLQKRNGQMK